MSQIFISYAHKDGTELAEFLYQRLTGCGYEVFKDNHNLKPGDPVTRAISDALDGTGDFIVLMTRAALDSAWVKDEVDMAMTVRRRVISIVAEDVRNDEIPLQQRKLLYLGMKEGKLDWKDLDRLVDTLDGGENIPRIYNMSNRDDAKIIGLLVLGASGKVDVKLDDPKDIVKKAKKVWEDALPILKHEAKTVGFVPTGLAPLACAVLALMVGAPNRGLRMYYPYSNPDGKFCVSADKFINLKELREFAQTEG